jgi:hypothetical protein
MDHSLQYLCPNLPHHRSLPLPPQELIASANHHVFLQLFELLGQSISDLLSFMQPPDQEWVDKA